MREHEIRLTQVYRINGRLIVANSIEGAINTWREFMRPSIPEIESIEKVNSDSYQCGGQQAIVCAEELCGEISAQFAEELAELNKEKESLTFRLKAQEEYCASLETKIQALTTCTGK